MTICLLVMRLKDGSKYCSKKNLFYSTDGDWLPQKKGINRQIPENESSKTKPGSKIKLTWTTGSGFQAKPGAKATLYGSVLTLDISSCDNVSSLICVLSVLLACHWREVLSGCLYDARSHIWCDFPSNAFVSPYMAKVVPCRTLHIGFGLKAVSLLV